MKTESQKILRLTAENVKRLSAVEISPAGDVVELAGDNGAGKSSVLDSICYALGGKEVQAPEVIRRGEKEAKVVLELDSLTVSRRWWRTAAGEIQTDLTVSSKDGATFTKPQSRLDAMLGKLSFDPLEFTQLDPKKQVELLRQLAGADFSELDAKRAAAYERRTEVGREVAQLKGRLASIGPMPESVPDEPVSVDALLEEHKKLTAQKEANDKQRSEGERLQRAADDAEMRVASAELTIEQLEEQIVQARIGLQNAQKTENNAQAALEKQAAVIAALVDPDVADVYRRIRTAEATNDAVRRKRERGAVQGQLEAKQREADQLTASIESVDAAKTSAIAAARLPVEGLSFNDTGVLLNGLPFEQASAAEQLRVSLAMGIALNPRIKVMLIRDASLLDKRSRQLVTEMAKSSGCQVWLEVVGEGAPGAVVIQDGHVLGAAQTSAPPPKTNGKAKHAEEK